MTKTFAERCHIAQQSLPDAQYKAMLTALHTEMLAALAEQPAQQEPVAWMQDSIELYVQDRPGASYTIPLYTSQAQRKPLTLQELEAAWNAQADHMNQWNTLGLDEMVAWAQAAHNIKEKNHDHTD